MSNHSLFTQAGTPEELGVPSKAILRFLHRIDQDRTCMHGYMMIKDGMIASQGYWKPYGEDSIHRMYSVSKSFVSLSVGCMIDEGKLSLEDRVIDFFQDKTKEPIHPYLKAVTVRDLLMMATPHSKNSYGRYDPDWAATFFDLAPSHMPGSIFAYDTAATVVLNTIVERIAKKPFLEYMRDKVLDPIGFSKDATCIKTPEGTSWGGSGVLCTLTDMAKLAYVCLNDGRWQDKQLISQDYIKAATSKQIDNSLNGSEGYGYQIWRTKHNGFAFRGMGSQLALCYPDKNFIFACISDTQGSGKTGDGIEVPFLEEVYDHLSDVPLLPDRQANLDLQEKIDNLAILPQDGESDSVIISKINGKTYEMDKNPMGIQTCRFDFSQNGGVFCYQNESGEHELAFGLGRTVAGDFPQTNYFGDQIGVCDGRKYRCLASAAFVEPHKLNMNVNIIDIYLGNLQCTFSFIEDTISVLMIKVAEWFLDEYQGFAAGRLR